MARDLETRVFTPVIPPEHKKQEQDFLRFVDYMNQKAAEIGMTGSHFCDAAGVHNVVTARDLLRLLAYADSYPELRKVWITEPGSFRIMQAMISSPYRLSGTPITCTSRTAGWV